jgi:DNA-directed RNA polymerase specialized sigma24 family protein
MLDIDAALQKLGVEDPLGADLVKLRYFVGLTLPEAAEALNISPRTADRIWAYARSWLRQELEPDEPGLGTGRKPETRDSKSEANPNDQK